MQEFAIFDFDGTITNLKVDWDLVRKRLLVDRISQIWSLSEINKLRAIEVISEHELNGLDHTLNFNRNRFKEFSHFSVLTNNSELVVTKFFVEMNNTMCGSGISPDLIVGRETLLAPKEQEKTFRDGISLIFRAMEVKNPSNCLYVGDQDYELNHAKKMGLAATHIKDFLLT